MPPPSSAQEDKPEVKHEEDEKVGVVAVENEAEMRKLDAKIKALESEFTFLKYSSTMVDEVIFSDKISKLESSLVTITQQASGSQNSLKAEIDSLRKDGEAWRVKQDHQKVH